MKFLKVLLFLAAIPTFGIWLSLHIIGDYNNQLLEIGVEHDIFTVCTPEVIQAMPDIAGICGTTGYLAWMFLGSILALGTAFILLVSYKIISLICGKSRKRISLFFPPLVFFSLLLLSALVFTEGAILTYGIYIAQVFFIESYYIYIILAVAAGALWAGCSLIGSCYKMTRKQKSTVIGKKLDLAKQTKIYEFVKDIGKKLGSKIPDNIVVGLEPSFYVTSADVQVVGDKKSSIGETLYLSLPLLRILTVDEIKAIIGHELGHFRGKDTYYSLKFAPVYSGLIHAIQTMSAKENEGGAAEISKIPAMVLLAYMVDVFDSNVNSISRDREFEADKAASEVASGEDLVKALLKISLYAHGWNDILNSVVERLKNGSTLKNLSILYGDLVRYDTDKNRLLELVKEISKDSIEHPTDTHPPTIKRIENLNINLDEIDLEFLIVNHGEAIELVDGYRTLEEELTILQQQFYVALGVEMPEEEKINYGARIIASFGAHMVLADGKIEASEIDRAESIGMELSENFDRMEFREYCNHPDTIPKLDDLITFSKEAGEEIKPILYDYLQEISGADGDMSLEEKELLLKVKNGLDIAGD